MHLTPSIPTLNRAQREYFHFLKNKREAAVNMTTRTSRIRGLLKNISSPEGSAASVSGSSTSSSIKTGELVLNLNSVSSSKFKSTFGNVNLYSPEPVLQTMIFTPASNPERRNVRQENFALLTILHCEQSLDKAFESFG